MKGTHYNLQKNDMIPHKENPKSCREKLLEFKKHSVFKMQN